MTGIAGTVHERINSVTAFRPQPKRVYLGSAARRVGRRQRWSGSACSSQPPSAGVSEQQAIKLPKLAFFVSGGGSNFKAIHKAVLDKRIAADVAVVVSDKPACGACEYASEFGIPILQYPDLGSASGSAGGPDALRDALQRDMRVDFIVLAGYLKLVPREVVAAFPKAILNIHPGLLPAFGGKGFYGSKVHQAVIASGARFSGPTVHFVDENYDTGPILAQRVIPVRPLEDHKQLAARVLKEEHLLYPETVAALVEGRITWRADGIPIMWEAK